jgi:hypothetical protein
VIRHVVRPPWILELDLRFGDRRGSDMIILGWTRDREVVSWPDYDDDLRKFEKRGRLDPVTWCVGRQRNLAAGQECFLLVQGQKHPRGLVAAGTTLSEPFPDET